MKFPVINFDLIAERMQNIETISAYVNAFNRTSFRWRLSTYAYHSVHVIIVNIFFIFNRIVITLSSRTTHNTAEARSKFKNLVTTTREIECEVKIHL